ncbi:glycosyltransferase [Phycicoccus sp. HDW14]|uniref:glycosyltransferase n=1 Tax=Phycicoccus sp. HDW14 TaxID=2714941 RepID=UPI0014092EF0|nr:glycosyltransferase [Phycicoccus sp. HDW14]QIM21462.1 glycosyltransferase [Phycicoccus sp. HDW14]
MPPSVTVLMTTYHGTSVAELERSVGCIVGQTRPPEEFLVVVDGPVPEALDAAIGRAAAEHPALRVERLPRNVGSGLASARGLELATGDFVARHDSDDVSLPTRLEEQMRRVEEHGLDLVGSAMLEFRGDPDTVLGLRSVPTSHEAILRRLPMNNPVNNPTSVFRRELALAVGGYSDLRYMQDYDLFARMLAAGARAENLAEPLVLFNAGDDMIARRGGWRMLRHELTIQRRLRAAGVIGTPRLAVNLVLRGAFRLVPRRLLGPVYALLFRRSQEVGA